MLQDDFDARYGFDNGFAEDQLFDGFQFFLDRRGFGKISRAAGAIEFTPFFGGYIGDADQRDIGAELVTLRNKAIIAGQNPHLGFVALKRLNGGTIHLPNRNKDNPDRERLALRFERYKALA